MDPSLSLTATGLRSCEHVDVQQRARQQRIQHDSDDGDDYDGIDDRAGPDDAVDGRLAGLTPLDIDIVVVSDQAGFPADLLHHRIAGIDAQAALDTTQLRAVADIDACRTDRDTLIAVDAVADSFAERA